MILQYKGFNNNWCYEEAETIIFANVWVGKEFPNMKQNRRRIQFIRMEVALSRESQTLSQGSSQFL